MPHYVLYGEHARRAAPGFVHVETLSSRSALHGWEIAPHRHEGLQQLLWVGEGGGEARLDRVRARFEGPALIVVPAPLVHAFTWQPGSEGHVLTLAADYVAALARNAEAAVARSLDTPRVLALAPGHAAASALAGLFERLARELQFGAPGMATAVAARVQLLMVEVARLAPPAEATVPAGAELWQRFRAAVEQSFRSCHGVAGIAAGIAVTRGRLDAICRRHAGRTGQQVIHDRLVLEAQRSLIYTGLTVAEIAYDLGFADPAYFTRFFARETGERPGAFRRRHRAANGTATDREQGGQAA
ncbi:helix-turn-helix domain-containing protein [Rhodovastum sp. RN2-1]|uniref:Helix-turn-helix domain-containing protein n=1 Tax=Limobrevibacterium gyesilva TaxID=2991712 RepID=A0AA41YUB5_9PROT|nr:helix-turn-helix domain-containing protein [Limobrevibacterium gyesilva]